MKKISVLKVLSIICILLSLFSVYIVNNIGIIPYYYILALLGIFIVINIILFRKRKLFKILGIILSIIILILNIIAIYYVKTTDNFLDKAFSGKVVESTTYYIVTSKSNKYSDKDIKGDIYYYKNISNKEKILKVLKNDYKLNIKEYDLINDMFRDLLDNKIKFVIMEKTSYNIMKDYDSKLAEDCVVVKEINIKEEKQTKVTSSDSFNIYIVGTDFAGLNDFNMLVTVNTKSKKVLLTSIPRDYHIEVAGMDGVKDNITYMSALGVDTSIKSLEKFFDINIDYYVKINTSSLVKLVDEIGGITYCSDYEFQTTHALVLDTYNDVGKKKLYVKKGCQHFNGIETLTVARERKKIPGSDLARQDNCRKIVVAIFNKLKSLDSAINYSQLLQSLSNSYETTLPREVIEKLGKDSLKSSSKWTIEEQAVTGSDVIGYVHLNTVRDYTMVPNMSSVESAINKIKELRSDKN